MPKRLKKLRTVIDSKKCTICLDAVKSDQGSLDCLHKAFCFDCILNWSKISNKCPLCMKKFFSIKNLKTKESLIIDDIVSESEESFYEYYYDSIKCEICKLGDNEDKMMLCDECDLGFHTTCIGLIRIPYLDYWFCPKCLKHQPEHIRLMQKEEIFSMREPELPQKHSRQNYQFLDLGEINLRRSKRLHKACEENFK